jgi:light-harvesting protein B-800-850 alpha chain
MNQKEIWCVVKPSVGLPLFLGSVAVTSLIVHYAILSHTTWMSAYWEGHKTVRASMVEPAVEPAKPAVLGSITQANGPTTLAALTTK